jgi:hypothetical protein
MKRLAALIATAACALLGLGATAAGASEPVVQGCVGTTFSEAAHVLQDERPFTLGRLLSGLAQAPGTEHAGLGDGIQQVQAGLVPDTVAVNACNN